MKMIRIASFKHILLFGSLIISGCKTGGNDPPIEAGREPVIEPDYSGITVPRNIAPMNFILKENGKSFKLVLTSSGGSELSVKVTKKNVEFPIKEWKKLLAGTGAGTIVVEVYAESEDGKVTKFKPFSFYVAGEPIDPFLCYRFLYPGFVD